MIKKYSTFLESYEKETDIYEWYSQLKMMIWSKETIDHDKLEKDVNHYIGEGWFKKIKDKVDSMYNSLSKVDLGYIEDRLLTIWDELPQKKKSVSVPILYGDYYNINNESDAKYTGVIYTKDKINVFIHILLNIVLPTLHKSTNSLEYLRKTKEQISISSPKWNCANFDIRNYDSAKADMVNYSVQNVLDMYHPGVVICFGTDHSERQKVSIKKIETLFDEHIESIVSELDYKKVIWDYSRYERRFSNEDLIYEYTLKILLK